MVAGIVMVTICLSSGLLSLALHHKRQMRKVTALYQIARSSLKTLGWLELATCELKVRILQASFLGAHIMVIDPCDVE